MSLIKIRGRTILSPILSEEERAEARALREHAVLHQRRLERRRNSQSQQCNYQYQKWHENAAVGHPHKYQQANTSIGTTSESKRRINIGETLRTNQRRIDSNYQSNQNTRFYNKNKVRQNSDVVDIKIYSSGETSSSSAPSSQGSGGEFPSEGLEDSPSAANVSVQTESSESVTTSTDLHHYLNNSLDTSIDTSISISQDVWHNSSSLAEVDEALLQAESPEMATNLILGRVHPSDVFNSGDKPSTSRQESQNTETTTSSMIILGRHSSSEKYASSEGQDAVTVGSVSLSFASVSEGSEELLDISEEDTNLSYQSEMDSDIQKIDKDNSIPEIVPTSSVSTNNSSASFNLNEAHKLRKEKWKDQSMASQRDSGRGTSHSDYLDSYLEQLAMKSSTSHGIPPTAKSTSGSQCSSMESSTVSVGFPASESSEVVSSIYSKPIVKCSPRSSISSIISERSSSEVVSTNSNKSANQSSPRGSVSSVISEKVSAKPRDRRAEEIVKEFSESETKLSEEQKIQKENEYIKAEMDEFKRLEDKDWQREVLSKPRASSATPEKKEKKPRRPRRWSSCQPLDPSRSVGSKYLDSYLGKLTDDAWLQFPTQLAERRMVYLSSDEYINSVKTRSPRLLDSQLTSTDQSETSASEETKNLHTSTESLLSSNPDCVTKESITEKGNAVPVSEHLFREQPDLKQSSNGKKILKCSSLSSHEEDILEDYNTEVSSKISAAVTSYTQNVSDLLIFQNKEMQIQDDKFVDTQTSINTDDLVNGNDRESKSKFDRLEDANNLSVKLMKTKDQNKQINENGEKNTESSSVSIYDNNVEQQRKEFIAISNVSAEIENVSDNQEGQLSRSLSKSSAVSDFCESIDEGQESFSEGSSETEPSTIVYLEDIPVESPNEGKTLLMGANEQVYSKVEKSSSELQEKKSKSNGTKDNTEQVKNDGTAILAVSSTNNIEVVKTSIQSIAEPSRKIDHNIQLISTQKTDKCKGEAVSEDSLRHLLRNKRGSRLFELDTESEEECLVVHVTVDEHKTTEERQNPIVCDIAKLETKKKAELIKANQFKGEIVSEKITNGEIESQKNSNKNNWDETLPDQVPNDAMSQVLTLFKVKQQQEIEELKKRQEDEIRQFIDKLQQVSPVQLQAFFNPIDKGTIHATHVSDSQKTYNDTTDIQNDRKDARSTKSMYSLGSNESVKKKYVNEEVEIKDSRNISENQYKYPVPHGTHPDVTKGECVWSSSYPRVAHTEYARDDNVASKCFTNPVQNYPTYVSNITYSTSVMSPSESASSNMNTSLIPNSYSVQNVSDRSSESPRPRPSNHTNIMPSYFMYEEGASSDEICKDDDYKVHKVEHCSAYVASISRPKIVPQTLYTLSNSEWNLSGSSSHAKNNNPEIVDTMSYANGNCVSYGDGMQYYRLFTGDEDYNMTRSTSFSSNQKHFQMSSSYPPPPQSRDTVIQPGLFRIVGNSPRPTSITSLLKNHPEMFGEEVLEVNVRHNGEWTTAETEIAEHHDHSSIHPSGSHHHSSGTSSVEADVDLDMVPEKENAAATPSHQMTEEYIFLRGIIRLQACARRFLTQRLLRTKYVQEQLATLSEIAKLAQQFHRDILTDNIQKGDVDFHRTLYNQERIARDRILRVFSIFSCKEQMELIRRDRQLLHVQQQKRQTRNDPRTSPARTQQKNRSQEDQQRLTVPKTVVRRSPTGHRSQPENDNDTKVTRLVQPTVIRQPPIVPTLSRHARAASIPKSVGHQENNPSSRGESKLPGQVSKSSFNLASVTQPQHRTVIRTNRSPSQDSHLHSRSSSHSHSRSGSSVPSRSSSTSRLCRGTSVQNSPKAGNRNTTTGRTCTIKNATNRVYQVRSESLPNGVFENMELNSSNNNNWVMILYFF